MKKLSIIFAFIIVAFSCDKYRPKELNYEDIFTFEVVSSSSAKADGISLIQLDLKSANSDIKSGFKATLETKAGTIIDTEKILDENGNATFYLRTSQDTSNYFVSIKVTDDTKQIYYKQEHFTVELARPDTIFIEASKSTYKLNEFITLKTFINRNQGKPSQKIPVSYSAYQLDNLNNQVKIGRFEGLYNNASSSEGTYADIKFYTDTQNIDTTKVITIRSETKKENNTLTFNQVNFSYKK